jgi:hypothetical protein
MPNTDECELSRVYVRNPGGLVAEESIKDNVIFEVVLEAEAGQALFNQGGAYKLITVVTDFTNDYITFFTNSVSGTFGDANWPNQVVQHAFTPPAAPGPGRDDHVFQAIGVVSAGRADPIVDTEFSDVFIITQP